VANGVTASGNFAGCQGIAPITYASGITGAAHPTSYYTQSMFSAINVIALNTSDNWRFTNPAYAYAFSSWWQDSAFILPASAGITAPVDWFIANPNKRIIDYCTKTTNNSNCQGSQNQGNAPSY
jgi:hypothetical protein